MRFLRQIVRISLLEKRELSAEVSGESRGGEIVMVGFAVRVCFERFSDMLAEGKGTFRYCERGIIGRSIENHEFEI